ncbi:site-2 protease family protein [Domibacillus indicus]|uniref:site-2 protease family protein n=1 Tax=Domibacillus TaxID=1433999 RepID=UPI00203B1B33|nr:MULTISPECIES: site-2 protease family protein [Domibacillus]MCM3788788.1 site-2 protease family protein [Domibacillus indicus]WNS81083.1 site-2 protease family protein [Domibacillus sp. DTU_2020_1001157_1_SI_ALB_TIR_016]
MEQFLAFELEQLPFVIVSLLVAFTVHEFAHAYTAYKFGDDTAKNQGRLTLNPVHHLDPIGTIFILIAGFGWARPVPVNRRHFKNPKLAGVLVSLAGPLSNFLIAFIAMGILYGVGANANEFVFQLLYMMVYLNVLLFVFNLLPFPPLDGYRILEDLAPANLRVKMTQYEQYGVLLFLILVITPLGDYTVSPFLSQLTSAVLAGFNAIFSVFL